MPTEHDVTFAKAHPQAKCQLNPLSGLHRVRRRPRQTERQTDGFPMTESRLVWVQNVITLAYCDYKVEKTRHFCRFHWMLESSKAFSFRGATLLTPDQGLCPGPRWGLRPQTPIIGSLPLAMTPAFRFLFLYDWSPGLRLGLGLTLQNLFFLMCCACSRYRAALYAAIANLILVTWDLNLCTFVFFSDYFMPRMMQEKYYMATR